MIVPLGRAVTADLKVGDTIYVGLGGRTNAEGIAQFAAIVEPLGATVITVPIS